MGLHVGTTETVAVRSLNIPADDVASVSVNDDILLIADEKAVGPGYVWAGTLKELHYGGGAPRPVMDNVQFADWDPEGKKFAVVRYVPETHKYRLEYPAGTVLYETSGMGGQSAIFSGWEDDCISGSSDFRRRPGQCGDGGPCGQGEEVEERLWFGAGAGLVPGREGDMAERRIWIIAFAVGGGVERKGAVVADGSGIAGYAGRIGEREGVGDQPGGAAGADGGDAGVS